MTSVKKSVESLIPDMDENTFTVKINKLQGIH